MNPRRVWKTLLWLWIATVWVLSTWKLHTPEIPNGDKVGHFVSYGVLAWLAANQEGGKMQVWLAASLMGVAVECVQYFLPWRSFELMDMLANSTGALLGTLLASIAVGRVLPRLEQRKKT